jgi:hypothetical protein
MMRLIVSLFFITSCGQSNNSSSGDSKYSSAGSSDAAIAIINSRCISCHEGYHDNWSNFTTFADYEDAGLVVGGSPLSSILITRLKNSGGDMPKNGPALDADEYLAVENWITNN